jgi:cobalt-zinc-cadmium efflux system protein
LTEHTHHHAIGVESKLKFGLILTASILVIEVVGGLLSNSLALLSDAGHVFADILALSLSLYGVMQAKRPASQGMTFGYHRVGVIIAVVNAFSIFAIAGIILYEAYGRFVQPPEVNSLLMLSVATVGLGVNIFVALWLRTEPRENLNIRSAFWHAFGDALASIGVIIGGIVMLLTGWFWVDPIISVLISVIIFIAAWQILRDGLRVLLEATPSGVDVNRMVDILKRTPGVKDVHDVHVWSISPGLHAMSSHVLIDDLSTSQAANIREQIEDMLQRQFNIEHTTLQMECQQCDSNDVFCTLTSGSHDKKDEKPQEQG